MVRKGALGVRVVKIWRDANWMRNEFGDSRKKERKRKMKSQGCDSIERHEL